VVDGVVEAEVPVEEVDLVDSAAAVLVAAVQVEAGRIFYAASVKVCISWLFRKIYIG
jgi:hypothetical protein